MIKYIHTTYTASGKNIKTLRRVYDNEARAMEELELLGGEVDVVEVKKTFIKKRGEHVRVK